MAEQRLHTPSLASALIQVEDVASQAASYRHLMWTPTFYSVPSGHLPVDAAQGTVVREDLPVEGGRVAFHGDAIEWDLAKSTQLTLTFRTLWPASRRFHLFIWSTAPVKLDIAVSVGSSRTDVELQAGPGNDRHPAELAIVAPDNPETWRRTEVLTVRLVGRAKEGTRVYFGIDGGKGAPRTQAVQTLRWNLGLATLVSTWAWTVFLSVYLGSRLTAFDLWWVFGLIPAVPEIAKPLLKPFGIELPFKLDVGALSRWAFLQARERLRPWMRPIYPASGVVPLLFGLWAGGAIATSTYFQWRLDQVLEPDATQADATALFCEFPERAEARVWLVHHLEQSRADRVLRQRAHDSFLEEHLPWPKFQACLHGFRPTRYLVRGHEAQDERAKLLYARVLFTSIRSLPQYQERMERIRGLLLDPAAPVRTRARSALTLLVYEAKFALRTAEDVCDRNRESAACADARAQCLTRRKSLEAALPRITAVLEDSVTYIEAHDIIATAQTLGTCRNGIEDAEALLNLGIVLTAVDRIQLKEESLSQLQIRQIADAMLSMDGSALNPVARSWYVACRRDENAPDCPNALRAMLGAYGKTYFNSDRALRRQHWEKPSLPQRRAEDIAIDLRKSAANNWRITPW